VFTTQKTSDYKDSEKMTYYHGKLTIYNEASLVYEGKSYLKSDAKAIVSTEDYQTLIIKIASFIIAATALLAGMIALLLIINSNTARNLGYGSMDRSQFPTIAIGLTSVALFASIFFLPTRKRFHVGLKINSTNSFLLIDTFESPEDAHQLESKINSQLASA
jgi:hypothetical protein